MGWLLVNIFIPIAVPLLGVLLLKCVSTGQPARGITDFRLLAMIKDGQLGWVAVGMCAAAFYEFIEALVAYNENLKRIPEHWFVISLPLFLCTLGGMFSAAVGAVYNTAYIVPNTNPSLRDLVFHYRTLVSSSIATLASAITFAIIHFEMLPRAISYNFPGLLP